MEEQDVQISRKDRRKYALYKRLQDLIIEMNYRVDAAIVEGQHDKKTMQLLGFNNPIILCSKLPYTKIVDVAAKKFSSIVILTDFDKQGEHFNQALINHLKQREVEVDDYSRRELQKILEEVKISTIEGIYRIKLELFS